MNYIEALSFIKEKESLGIQPGLVRIKKVLNKLDNPQNKFKTIHIAGTNGKGTVAATLAKALTDNGFKTGLFTSPWVTDYREQLQINSQMIGKKELANILSRIKDFDCTEFELITIAAYVYFAEANVDYAIIECGMGGAEDATNTENENLSVITSISLDHTDFLGTSIEEIANNKAGILRKNSTCVLYNRELSKLFENKCRKLVLCPEKDNLTLVNTVLTELGLNTVRSLEMLPARQERIGGVLLDGGHNVSAAKSLAPLLDNETALIAMLKDKDVEGYLSIVAPKCKKIIATTVNSKRALNETALANIAKKYCNNVVVENNSDTALKIYKPSLICGSFYLAREVRKKLISKI